MKTAFAVILALLLIVSGAFIYHNNISVDDLTGKAISFSRFGSLIERIRAPSASIGGDANTTYPIHLSATDATNPAFSSVNLGKYQAFQTANPQVFEQMIWTSARNPTGKSIIYSNPNMEKLSYYLALLESNQPFPYTAPPAGTIRRVSGENKTYFTEEQALNMWLPHIAVSLYVEVNKLVNWSVKSYNNEELAILFDGRKFLTYNYAGVEGYTISFHYLNPSGIDGITDWNPFYTLEFLKSKKIITIPRTLPFPEPSRPIIGARETVSFAKPEIEAQKKAIYALTQWMRANLVHQTSTSAEEYAEIYSYEGPFPLDKVLNPPTGAKSMTIGCSGTSSMYNAILGLINIPVTKSRSMDRHTAPLFTTAGIALIHGDDPYMLYYLRGTKEVSAKDMFVTIDEFHAMNTAPLEAYEGYTPDRGEQVEYLHNVQAARKAYASKAYILLRERAADVLLRIPRGLTDNTLEHDWTTMFWKPMFNSTEMSAMFSGMDSEIRRIGAGNYTEGYNRICRGLITPTPRC
ncbi:MAG: hypothetical protein WC852_04110 [Candidatus Nanoarchaeia archaeon]|jgi:hypothetical protein